MKAIILKKVSVKEATELQQMIRNYSDRQEQNLNPQMTLLFFDTIMQLEIMKRLLILFRSKIESERPHFRITLKASESVVLLYSCQFSFSDDPANSYRLHVADKYKNDMDQQLKSLIIPKYYTLLN